ncbi:uncharacterized protein LTR77_005952 [Saxophila tyrrhenica]|uniref:Poly(A) RNA polymerase mitochondrial-like central palm domain-containing protein n=1 Tax=Saxophila tyrrhenica TaxID=1690608 RepID=A0AAV9P6Z8_9PEZI|nr:hypothetical protein LTR77_005952 [Saxophila tyrrhenica]
MPLVQCLRSLRSFLPKSTSGLQHHRLPPQSQQRRSYATAQRRSREVNDKVSGPGAGGLFANYEALRQKFGDEVTEPELRPNTRQALRVRTHSSNGERPEKKFTPRAVSDDSSNDGLRPRDEFRQQLGLKRKGASKPSARQHDGSLGRDKWRRRRDAIRKEANQQAAKEQEVMFRTVKLEVKEDARPTRKDRPRPSSLRSSGDRQEEPNTLSWQERMREIAENAHHLSRTRRVEDGIAARQLDLDYRGIVIDAPIRPSVHPSPLPWAVEAQSRAELDGNALLDLEIAKFAQYIDLSPTEAVARQSAIDEVLSITSGYMNRSAEQHQVHADHKVHAEVQGSQKTGLATPTSDIDFRVSWAVPRATSSPTGSLVPRMEGLSRHLKWTRLFRAVEYRAAHYPIITATHKPSDIDIQIVGAPDTAPQQAITAQYLAEIPNLKSLYLLLRTALGIRGLVDVYSGGTGAYGLFMMLVAALQRKSSSPPATAGEQLMRFLDFYTELDTTKFGVSVSPPKLFMKHDGSELAIKDQIDAARRRGDHVRAGQWAIGQRRAYQPYLLCLQDSANPVNDLGRKTNAIKHIRRTLEVMRATLKQDVKDIDAARAKNEAWSEPSILEPMLGRCNDVLVNRRKQMEKYGAKVMLERERQGLQAEQEQVEEAERS